MMSYITGDASTPSGPLYKEDAEGKQTQYAHLLTTFELDSYVTDDVSTYFTSRSSVY